MLDPITALSIAAAVAQFVVFGTELISKARRYKSANRVLSENVELEKPLIVCST
jgi:hypothetical protein